MWKRPGNGAVLFIVIGTKGFGKTLLLKAKRIIYQQDRRAACLPSGSLLDKPIGDKIFGREAPAFFATSPLPWSKLWLTAIAVATLKHLDQARELRVGPKLAALIADGHLRRVVDHFVRLLDFSPSDLQRCAADTDGRLVPRLRAAACPVSIFIDGIRLCVLKADVRGFGELMLAGTDGPVRAALEEAVRRNTQGAVCVEAGGGDAVLIAHEDPTALAQAARHLIDEVYRAPGQPRLRVALHYGEVRLRQRPGDGPAAIGGGEAVLLATRVEPHVDPGQIWATEEFRERLFEKP
jgi:class 3 adenylate cyclase